MECDSRIAEEEFNISLVRMVRAMEFLITFVSNHAKMILCQSWAHFELLNKKLAILELKLQQLQLATELLCFRVNNLAQAENINAG